MLAKLARQLPVGDQLVYEPKWDGFRCIVFRDGDETFLGSRNERPLDRWFPELAAPLRAHLPSRCVMDGEIVIAGSGGLDFDALLQRIHPAASRIRLLSESTPASFVAFDLLAIGDEDLRTLPFGERRDRLEQALALARPPIHLTPATSDPVVAADWFQRFEGAGLDGVVAKAANLTYRSDERVMVKVKHERTADCVVGGFRWYRPSAKAGGGTEPVIGSLLLGLYDEEGTLHHVGVAASFTAQRRRELLDEVGPYRDGALSGHPWSEWAAPAGESGQMPGAQSRWTAGRDLSWEPLRPDLVAEVAYEHLQGRRFRHGARFRHWRSDRDPLSCTYEQLDTAVPEELSRVFEAGADLKAPAGIPDPADKV